MDCWELFPKVDGIFVSIVFKVAPQATVEDDRVRCFSSGRGEDEKFVSLSVSPIIDSYSRDMRVSCLWRVWFEVCYYIFVELTDGFRLLSFVRSRFYFSCSPSSVMEWAVIVFAECPMFPTMTLG